MRSSFFSHLALLLLLAGVSGIAAWLLPHLLPPDEALAYAPMASAIPIHAEGDDPCNPRFLFPPDSRSSSGSLSGALQSELCPPVGIQYHIEPMEPIDRCPPKEPCAYPPHPTDEQQGGGGPGAMGWSLPSSALPQLHDGTPSPLFAADYGGDSLRRAQSLDSPFLDVTTGKLSLEEVDILLPGSGLDFRLTRSYHSFLAGYKGQFGAGWEVSVHRRVQATFGTDDVPLSLQLVTGGGYPTGEFFPTSPTGWYAQDDRKERFYFTDAPPGTNDTLTLYDPSGLVETFERLDATEPWFYLVQAASPAGATTVFSYSVDPDAIPTTRELESATDSAGRTIEFDFDTSNLLVEVRIQSGAQLLAQVDYEYWDPGGAEPYLLRKVTGLEVATENPANGQVLMQRRVREYSYVQNAGLWYLASVTNGNGQSEYSWTYEAGAGGRVATQTDRPGHPTTEAVHQYTYTGNPVTKSEYLGPEGERREWILSSGRVTVMRELVDPTASTWATTSYVYDTGCGCSRIQEITYPDGRRLHVAFDAQGNPASVWNYAAPGFNTVTRVERFLWSTFDPVDPGLRMTRLLQHELPRDAENGEAPGNQCDKPDCGSTYGADGWILHTYTWDANAPWKLNEIDYGTIESGTGPLAGLITRKESFTYHPNGTLATRRHLQGGLEIARTEYTLDATGGFVSGVKVVDPVNGGEWETFYERNALGRIVQTEHEDGTVTRSERDAGGRVWRILEDFQPGTQSATRITDLRYDGEGRLVKQVTTAGSLESVLAYALDATGRPISVTATGPGGPARTASFVVDKSGLLLSVTDWRGVQYGTDYQAGAWRLPTRRWEAYQGAERTMWRAGDGGTDPDGYDSMGRLTSWRNAADWVTVIEYDGHGRFKEEFRQSDAAHASGRHVNYDARGFVSEVEVGMIQGTPQNPTAVSWNEHHVLNHNLAGHLLAWALYEGNASNPSLGRRYRVDLRGRRELVLDYQGDRSAGMANATPIARDFAWDALDRVIEERQLASWPNGAALETTDYWFDDGARLLDVIITGENSAYKEKARAQRDALGRLTSITEWEWAGGQWGQSRAFSREWDGLDRQTAAVDPLGKRWEWTFDDLHRTTTEQVKPVGQGPIFQTSWVYDSSTGLLSSVTDADGKVTSYTHHAGNTDFLLPKRTTHPDGRWEEVFDYDVLLRPTSLGDSRGVVRTLAWDFGYLISDDSNAESLISGGDPHFAGPDEMRWEYDRMQGTPVWSKVLTAGVESWRTEFTHNKLGELTSEKQGLLGSQHRFSWIYGFGGETRSVSYPGGLGLDSGVIGRDGAGRVTSVEYQKSGQLLADYALAYDGLRSKQRVEALSGVQLDYGFDSWNRLTGMVWSKGGATLDGQQRSLDLGNRVIARQRALDATGEIFSHDGHHRMTAWWQGVPGALAWTGASDPASWTEVERYTLDAVLARQQTERQAFGDSPVTTAYAQNAAHFPTQVGAESRTVHEGFLNGDGTFYYRWDAWGRLTEVREAATGQVRRTHLYDAEGRRVLETEVEGGASKTTRYVFWGRGLAASYDVAGGNTRTYGFVGGADGEAFVRVQQGGGDELFELARDFQGSVLALIQRTNPSSVSVAERYRYEPFGKVAIEDGGGQPLAASAFGNERFFLGRIWDAELGIYDVRARWYEPDVGGFLAADPLGAVDSLNSYQYGLAAPGTLLDSTGLVSQEPGQEPGWTTNSYQLGDGRVGDYIRSGSGDWYYFPDGVDCPGCAGHDGSALHPDSGVMVSNPGLVEELNQIEEFYGPAREMEALADRLDRFSNIPIVGDAVGKIADLVRGAGLANRARAGQLQKGEVFRFGTGVILGMLLHYKLKVGKCDALDGYQYTDKVRRQRNGFPGGVGEDTRHRVPWEVDNFRGEGTVTVLESGAVKVEVGGSMNGVDGTFEWIGDPTTGTINHMNFIPNE